MTKKNLTVLQLASFHGNIGDNANHSGSRSYFKNSFQEFNLQFTNLEIREFFRKERAYDSELIEYINQFDLLIVGGGNFFELWVDYSCNNTSIDIDVPLLKQLKTPTLFYALGVDAGMGVSQKGIKKFQKWLDYVISEDKFFLTVRNDGAMATLKKEIGENYAKHFTTIPDGGFFLTTKSFENIEIYPKRRHLGINIAGDMLDLRFQGSKTNSLSYEEFSIEFVNGLTQIIEKFPDMDIVFYPHIFKDLDIISRIVHAFNDKYSRTRIRVAPYIQNDIAKDYIFSSYACCDLILGNRFHSNVCAIGQGVPSIGLVNYPQVKFLYDELQMPNRAIDIRKKGFSNQLYTLITQTFFEEEKVKKEYQNVLATLNEQANSVFSDIHNWFTKQNENG